MSSKLVFDHIQKQEASKQERQQKSQLILLTLEDISPVWASRLNQKLPTFMSIRWLQWRSELQLADICVVGEAYGYSSPYTSNCDECREIGCNFLFYFSICWYRKLEENKQKFVKHWNEKHRYQEHDKTK
jgi:hypothetical protein